MNYEPLKWDCEWKDVFMTWIGGKVKEVLTVSLDLSGRVIKKFYEHKEDKEGILFWSWLCDLSASLPVHLEEIIIAPIPPWKNCLALHKLYLQEMKKDARRDAEWIIIEELK